MRCRHVTRVISTGDNCCAAQRANADASLFFRLQCAAFSKRPGVTHRIQHCIYILTCLSYTVSTVPSFSSLKHISFWLHAPSYPVSSQPALLLFLTLCTLFSAASSPQHPRANVVGDGSGGDGNAPPARWQRWLHLSVARALLAPVSRLEEKRVRYATHPPLALDGLLHAFPSAGASHARLAAPRS